MFDETTINQLRGSTMVDQDGDKVGRVEQVYLDDATGQPTWVTVATGLFGTRETFVPLDRAAWEGDALRVPFEKGFIKDAPNLEANGHLNPSEEDELYRFYGIGGSLGGGLTGRDVRDTDLTGRDVRDTDLTGRDVRDTDATSPQERVDVGNERRGTGRARLRRYELTDDERYSTGAPRDDVDPGGFRR